MSSNRRGVRRRVYALAMAAAAVPLPALAADRTWSTLGGNGLWSSSLNWSGFNPPVAGDNAYLFQTATSDFTAEFNISSNPAFNNLRVGGAIGGTNRSFSLLLASSVNMSFVNESIGYDGLGIFDHSSGTNSISGALNLGELAGGNGTYSISSGNLLTPAIYLGGSSTGAGGRGSLSLTGAGSRVTASGVVKAWGASSTMTLGGGTLVAGSIALPNWSQFTFNAGTLNLSGAATNAGTFTIGRVSGSSSASFQSGSTVSASTLIAGSASGSVALVTQSGNASFTNLTIGANAGSFGTYIKTGAAQTLSVSSVTTVGDRGNGTFTHNGGSHTTGNLYLGNDLGASGTYTLGTGASLTVAFDTVVGASGGVGTFNHQGGTHVAGNLKLWWDAATVYQFSSGSLNVLDTESIFAGTFIQRGSAVHTANKLLIQPRGPTVPAAFILGGGTLTASVTNYGTFRLNQDDSFAIPTLAGTFENRGLFTVDSLNAAWPPMVIAASVVNRGTFSLIYGGASLTGSLSNVTGSPISGNGWLSIAPTGLFEGFGIVTVASIDNAGTLLGRYGNMILAPGALNNTGTLGNAPGGSLFIQSPSFTNAGNLVINAGGTVAFDSALLIPAGKTATLAGGVLATPTLTNVGTVTGSGQISGNLINQAAATFNGPTQLYGTLTNTSTGLLTVRNSQLLITGAAVNSGTIRAMLGGTVVFDGGLTGDPPVPAPLPGGPLAANLTDPPVLRGSVMLDAGGAMVVNHVRQASLVLSGNAGDPASYSRLLIRDSAQGGQTSVLASLQIQSDGGGNPLGRLDLADNALIIDYAGSSPAASVRGLLAAGRAADTWAGNGITSSWAAARPLDRALGYAEAAQALDLSGNQTASFMGQVVDATALLVRYTVLGDSNLDGVVNFTDLVAVAQNYETSGSWQTGDFNYDGNVNFSDLVAVAQNYERSLAQSAPIAGASSDFAADWALAQQAAVPEPGLISLLAPGAALLLWRRRRRS